MIELVINQLKRQLMSTDFIFVIDKNEAVEFSLGHSVALAAGESTEVIERSGVTSGALCSCLLAVDKLDLEKPLLISNSDQILDCDLLSAIEQFDAVSAAAGVLTFDSVHPRWSYLVDGGDNRVLQVFEKKVVSRDAIAGVYYFSKARQFCDAAMECVLNDVSVNGEFFISSVLNQLMLSGNEVVFSKIRSIDYHSFYSPSRITDFEKSSLARSIRQRNKQEPSEVNVIIPAAGEGSRFAKMGWKSPKPFLDVDGQPMLEHVIDNVLPNRGKVTLLIRQSHADKRPNVVQKFEENGVNIKYVERLTEGTACTVLLARKAYDNDNPMMVANSDQLVDFDVSDYVSDCRDRGLDGSILVFRDPSMNPKWSFAKVNEDGLVTEVAEKKPISDLATVGIYLFSRGRDFVSACADMIAANERVNNEFYTCPVYNYMIKNGAKIGVYEVPMDAMKGLGTPEDLVSYLEYKGLPESLDAPSVKQ